MSKANDDEDSDGWVNVSDSDDCGEEEESDDDDNDKISIADTDVNDPNSTSNTDKQIESNDAIPEAGIAECPSNNNKAEGTAKETNAEKETGAAKTSLEINSCDKKEKAMVVSVNRILSQEEFHKVKVAQIAKHVQPARGKKRRQQPDDNEIDLNNRKELVSLSDIERLHKRPRPDKETRLATVMEGKKDREKFGKRKKKSEFSSQTQKMKNKNKAFMMVKHKIRSKTKRSFKDKQIALKKSLLKRRRN